MAKMRAGKVVVLASTFAKKDYYAYFGQSLAE